MAARLVLLALTVAASGCGGGTSTETSSENVSVPEYVPPTVRQEWLRVLSPPVGTSAVLFWGLAIHDTRATGVSEVLVDWERLVCRVGTQDIEVDRNDYGSSMPGGLCPKRPWCADIVDGLPVTVDAARGIAVLTPSSRTEHVFHWWGSYDWPIGRPAIPSGASRCWVEARVKIIGPAMVQIGFDWYPSRTGAGGAAGGVIEGAVSNWAGTGSDWQIVSVGSP